MRLFVTGGAGYVGSVVTEHLLRAGHDVVVFDDLSTGHRGAVPGAARFVQGDLRDAAALEGALEPGTDAILHFAGRSIVPDSMQDPVGYWDHNLGGALALLRVAMARGVPRWVFSSSAAVYGTQGHEPIPESAPLRPEHAYGGSKRGIEMLLEDACRTTPLGAIALRYFNAAGASAERGEDHGPETHLIPRLLRTALTGGAPFVVYGDDWPTPDGTCVRDYVHVEDLAHAHVQALAALDQGVTGPLNLGTTAGHSVRQILAVVRRVTGCEIPVTVGARRPGDPAWLVADASRARRELGWQAQATLEDMVRSAWDWMRAHPAGYGDRAASNETPNGG